MASQLPAQISVIHCRAHKGQNDKISKVNDFADSDAKAIITWMTQLRSPTSNITNFHPLKKNAFQKEIDKWIKKGAKKKFNCPMEIT